eukprot:5082806-Prymnesium_polylepis.1
MQGSGRCATWRPVLYRYTGEGGGVGSWRPLHAPSRPAAASGTELCAHRQGSRGSAAPADCDDVLQACAQWDSRRPVRRWNACERGRRSGTGGSGSHCVG